MEPGLQVGCDGEHLVAGLLPMGSDRAQPEAVAWDPSLPLNHLQEGQKGSVALCVGWQLKVETLAF